MVFGCPWLLECIAADDDAPAYTSALLHLYMSPSLILLEPLRCALEEHFSLRKQSKMDLDSWSEPNGEYVFIRTKTSAIHKFHTLRSIRSASIAAVPRSVWPILKIWYRFTGWCFWIRRGRISRSHNKCTYMHIFKPTSGGANWRIASVYAWLSK